MSGQVRVTIVVNGEPRWVPAGTTVEEVVTSFVRPPAGIAVALNGAVVPKSAWAGTRLAGEDRVEILTAAQGG